MAVVHSSESIPALSAAAGGCDCSVCLQPISNSQECLITLCSHVYHKNCIINWLTSSQDCPCCRSTCNLRDLQPINIKEPTNKNHSNVTSNSRGRGRGTIPKRYNTRNYKRRLYEESSQASTNNNTHENQRRNENPNLSLPLINLDTAVHNNVNPPRTNSINVNHTTSNPQSAARSNAVDYEQVSRMIENTVQRLFANIQVSQNSNNISVSQNNPYDPQIADEMQFSNPHSNPGKFLKIVQNWNVQFDGSSTGLSCEEFIYRIQSLTAECLNNNFDAVCKNLHILLSGKAKDWFWRYHKQVAHIEWQEFCRALKYEFKEHKSDYDIREEIRNRKQRPAESFEQFYDAITKLIDHLSSARTESDLIEILSRNLRPDIRHELLYVPIHSISHLRKLCQMRENLLNEEAFRRIQPSRNFSNNFSQRRNVNAIEAAEEEQNELAVDEIQSCITCWNCDEDGHCWDMCLKDRNIFCYGCGTKNVYKPQCVKCKERKAENRMKGPFNKTRMDPK